MSFDSPSEYRYHLTTEELVFAVIANDESFAKRAAEMRKKGVERLTGNQIGKMHRGTNLAYFNNSLYTFIHEAEVVGDAIRLADIKGPIHSIFIYKSIVPDVTITNCQLGQLEDDKSYQGATNFIIAKSMTGNFHIDQSTTGYFSISTSTTGDFRIQNQNTTGDFYIELSTTGFFLIQQSVTGYFSICLCRTEYFDIYNQSKTGRFDIDNSTTGGFRISDSTSGDFTINKSTIGNFDIYQSTTRNFSVKESATGDFDIEGSKLDNFIGFSLYNSINLQKATIAEIRLIHCYIPCLVLSVGCKAEMYISDSAINLIDLRHMTLSRDSVLSLFNCSIYCCLMEEFAVLGNLFFRQSQVLSMPFSWNNVVDWIGHTPDDHNRENPQYQTVETLLNQHAIAYEQHIIRLKTSELDNLKKKGLGVVTPTFRITQSSLGKAEFTDCDLGNFRFEYNNSKITDVFMTGGTAPEAGIVIFKATSENGQEPDLLKHEEQKVSIYNQLKKIFEGQGDIYRATHFQAKTAEHQTEVLKIRKGEEKGWFGITTWDLRTLQLNGLSNNHGESWGQALLFTFVGAAVTYALYLLFIGRLFHVHSSIDWDLVGQYFNFLDPTHKDDFIKEATQNFWSRFIHFSGRVWVGYGIFQFISAFRKHGKK